MSVGVPGRERLAVAVDVPGLAEADQLLERLDGVPGWLKVGSELFTAAGPAALARAAAAGRVFLDTKLHDIPNTVARAVAAAARHGVAMLTVHAAGGAAMLRAAREAADRARPAGGERVRIVAVTVLTSLSPADLKEVGVAASQVAEQVDRLVELALATGIDGVVASPHEAERVRRRAGAGLYLVTPGVRPSDWGSDDQVRTASAGDAIRAGSDLIVVGRPIVRAQDPAAAARRIVSEIERAVADRGA